MSPDENYETQLKEQEAEKLKMFVDSLSERDRISIYNEGMVMVMSICV